MTLWRPTRRAVLAGGTALALRPTLALAAAEELRAGVHQVQLAPEGYPATEVWAYGGTLPGPEIRVPQGGRVARDFVNDLPQPSTVHWHGIRLPNAMDGVPGLTQDPVPPGGRFAYDFAVPDAGTYWYHTHFNAPEQTARGLHGPLIVEEAEPPEVDLEAVLVLTDWRLVDPAAISEDFDNPHDASHAGRVGNYVTVAGLPELSLPAARHDRLRLRLINASPARIFELRLKGVEGWVVALDGMPVESLLPAEQMFLGPAQRIDLIVDVTAEAGGEAFLLEIVQGQGFSLVTLPVAEGTRARRDAPAPLPPNPGQPVPDLAEARSLPMLMEGGAMRGLASAKAGAETLDGEALARRGLFWTLAGSAGLPETPFADLARGEVLRVPLINQTAFPHAMHLHGHHFRELLPSGGMGPARDTILVDPGEVREIAFVADNPGDWLLHCHMIAHHAAGMGTWIRVKD